MRSNANKRHLNMLPALVSGSINTLLFSYPDRVIYLAQIYHRSVSAQFKILFENLHSKIKQPNAKIFSLLCNELFPSGLQGALSKTYTNSTYYICQGIIDDYLTPIKQQYKLSENFVAITRGILAGSINSVLFAVPMSTLRYTTFNRNYQPMHSVAKDMYHQGGLKIFYTGLAASLIRDIIFGVIYETSRIKINSQLQKLGLLQERTSQAISNFISGSLAIIGSAVFNYARNLQCSQLFDAHQKTMNQHINDLCHYVWYGSENFTDISFSARIMRLQRKLVINAAIIRVAAGLMIGQAIFDSIKSLSTKPSNCLKTPLLHKWQSLTAKPELSENDPLFDSNYKYSPFEIVI